MNIPAVCDLQLTSDKSLLHRHEVGRDSERRSEMQGDAGVPTIWPKVATDPLSGTASVDAPVPRRFAVSQLSVGPEMENAKETAMHSTA